MHVIDKHSEKEDIERESAFICGQCGLNFDSMDLCNSHINSHSFKCYKCEFESDERSEVKKHERSEHVTLKCNQEDVLNELNKEKIQKDDSIKFKCSLCNYNMKSREELEVHNATHVNKPVPLMSQPQRIECDQCNFIGEDVATFVKHIRSVHTAEHCQYCDYRAKDREELQSHLIKHHEEIVLLHSMSQQVNEISDRFELFETFKDELGDVIKSIAEAHNAVKQELFLIRNKQAELSSANIGSAKHPANYDIPSVKPPPATASVSPPSPESASSSTLPPQASSSSSVKPSKPKERKILLVGDSISANVNLKALEFATDAKISTARAYSAVHDIVGNAAKQKARFPKSNFEEVVPAQLRKDDYQTLVLQAASVDITNLNTKDDPTEYIDYFKEQTVSSAKRFFKTGEKALSDQPSLEKVVMMKQTPRYDPANVDPMCIKPALAELYNNTMTEQWMDSLHKDKIVIGNHSIECSGAIREARYRITKTGKFDGIHLYGSSGRKAYTNSVLNILKFAQLTNSDFNFHLSCPQYTHQQQYRHRQQTAGRTENRNVRSEHEVFSVPMKNRFETLSGLNQGNL